MSAAPRYRRFTATQRRAMLIDAGLACLSKGGIAAFTVDNICEEARASRGLIRHHFKSKDGLLSAVYEEMYERMFLIALPEQDASLTTIVEALFDDGLVEADTLNAWLALWSEVRNNPILQKAHRHYYTLYHARISAAIEVAAVGRTLTIQTDALALMFVSLVDGLWLERAIDSDRLSNSEARCACLSLLGAFLGPAIDFG
jgi:TetR/AcrR family transcriptional repressor of bet genes